MTSPPNTALEYFITSAAKYEASTGGCTRELARYLIELSPSIDSDSHVLDNACGNGIVAQEILFNRYAAGKAPPAITCVDGAPAMVDLARATCNTIVDVNQTRVGAESKNMTFDAMSGEELRFTDNYFTHSITNQGILFFQDAKKGADEIYRTIKPGGTAIVTSWKVLGYLPVIQEAQKVVTPDAPLFRIPIPEHWFQASHLGETLRGAGFSDVDVHEKDVYYAFKTKDELCDMLLKMLGSIAPDLTEQHNAEFKKRFEIAAEKVILKIERVVPGDIEGRTEELVGLRMVALVGVAKK